MHGPPSPCTLFPYPTLFRSGGKKKAASFRGRLPLALSRSRSELKLQIQLQNSAGYGRALEVAIGAVWRNHGALALAKSGTKVSDVRIRIGKVRMIEHVERIGAQRENESLCHLYVLLQREVGVEVTRATKLVTR